MVTPLQSGEVMDEIMLPTNPGVVRGLNEQNLQAVNLSDYVLTHIELQVLQKGLTFLPTQTVDKFTVFKDLFLFCRQVMFKVLYHQPFIMEHLAIEDRQPFQDLNEEPTGRRCFTNRTPSQLTP